MIKPKNSFSEEIIAKTKKESNSPLQKTKQDKKSTTNDTSNNQNTVYDYSLPTSSSRRQGKYTSFITQSASQSSTDQKGTNGGTSKYSDFLKQQGIQFNSPQQRYTGENKYTDYLKAQGVQFNKIAEKTDIKIDAKFASQDNQRQHIKPEPTQKVESDYSAYGKDYLDLLAYNEEFRKKISGQYELREAELEVAVNNYDKAAVNFEHAQKECEDIITEYGGYYDKTGQLVFDTNVAVETCN